ILHGVWPATDNWQPATAAARLTMANQSDALLRAQAEVDELKKLIAALRQEIEEILGDKQQMAASNQDHVTQLTATIVAMREEMERMHADKQESVQQAIADSTQE